MAISVGIIGASGYTGAELLRLLDQHPEFEVEYVTAHTQAGQSVPSLYPHLASYKHLNFESYETVQDELDTCRVVFCGLPHGEAQNILPDCSAGLIVDLGSDFRLDDPSLYETWYGSEHTAPEELENWTYGLTELFRSEIKSANRVANPGCYPTASTLAVAPLLKAGLIDSTIVIDAISGTSGAGRVPKPGLHFAHVFEDVCAYKVAKHQHTAEIEMALSKYSGKNALVSFTAHLAPMVRGIHATCSATVGANVKRDDLLNALSAAYAIEPFISIAEQPPGTKQVRGSNSVVIFADVDHRTSRAIVTVVIDNLVKGAAGQAIQNANLVLGLDEKTGLSEVGVYP